MPPFEVAIETHYSLYQLLVELTRCNRYNSSKLTQGIKDQLLKETYLDSQGKRQKMFLYPTPAGATTRNFLSIQREAIPQFLKKWGSFFQVPEHIIQSIEETKDLPDVSDNMISIFDFCKRCKAPHSLAFWIEENAFSFFKNKSNETSFFVEAKDAFMFKSVLLYKDRLSDFVLKNQEILKFQGLPQQVVEQAKKERLLTYLEENKNQKYTKEDEVETPFIRLDELCKTLKKTSVFIPYLRKFIVQNCLNDTFDLKIENMPPIQMPIFSYYQAFKKNKSSCYIYKQAIPYFVQKHENELIGIGIKQATLNEILSKNSLKSKFTSKIISFQEAYFLSIPNVTYPEFKRILSTTPLPHSEAEDGILFVETTKKDPYFINTNTLVEVLKTKADELGLNPLAIERVEMILQSPQKAVIPVAYFLKNIGISVQKAAAFNTRILKPHKNQTLTYKNRAGQEQKVVPFGHAKTASGQIFLGVFLDATEAIIQNFVVELKEISSFKTKSRPMAQKEPFFPINIQISNQFKIIQHLFSKENEKES